MTQQLTFCISLKDEATFANFYQGNNAQIVEDLRRTAAGEGEPTIYLYGIQGQGRSHLLQACCHRAHQKQRTSVYLPLEQWPSLSPDILIGLEVMDLVCIDDLQAIAGQEAWEEALFHLFNRICDANHGIIMAATSLPKMLNFNLQDLTSRLAGSVVYQLQSLCDEEKLIVLTMRSERRGIHLSEDVAKYILTHCERHMSALFNVLDKLDTASLAAQRRLTIPFVKEVLQM